ncbi:MAG: hypothetical protein GX974_04025 [Clostridiales bacterium]|nr:hypothetical protein [Clostridiales bacterium]
MKKKSVLIILTLVLILGATTAFVYGATPSIGEDFNDAAPDNRWEWFKEKMEHRRARVEEALKEDQITENEAKVWNEHMEYMEKFHKENNFLPRCAGYGRMHGRHYRHGYRRGFRGGIEAGD